MNDLPQRGLAPAAAPAQPKISRALAEVVERKANPGAYGIAIAEPVVTDPMRREARSLLAVAAARAAPVHREAQTAWIGALFDLVGTTEGTLGHRLAGALEATDGLAAGAFTDATRRDAVRAFEFVPNGAKLYEFLEPISRGLRNRAKALRDIAEAPTPVAKSEPRPSTADREAVAAMVREATRQMRADAEPVFGRAVAPPKPSHLSGEQLRKLAASQGVHLPASHYRQEGDGFDTAGNPENSAVEGD